MRDKRNNHNYFDELLQIENRSLNNFKEKLNNNVLSEEVAENLTIAIQEFYLRKFSLGYSIGFNRDYFTSLFEDFFISQMTFKTSFKGRYEQILWMLSIYYCLEIETPLLNDIILNIEESNLNDKLISCIIKGIKHNHQITSDYKFEEPYKHLDKILSNNDNYSILNLKEYLENKWYQGSKDALWYNSHKDKAGFEYTGYWSFESAALVKMFGLDDSSLQGVDYYPYDLLRMNQIS